MKRGTSRHRKILTLASLLKIEPYSALGLMGYLWDWAAEACVNGCIGTMDDADIIAGELRWRKRGKDLLVALIKAGLVDDHPTAGLIVHDWPDHCPDGVHTYLLRRRLRFADGSAPDTNLLPSGERDAANEFYGKPKKAAVGKSGNTTNPPTSTVGNTTPVPQAGCGENVESPPNDQGVKMDGTVRDGTNRNDTDRNATDSPNNVCSSKATNDGGSDKPNKPPKLLPEYTEAFEAFWKRYPRVRRVNKVGTFKIWQRDQIERPAEPGKKRLLDLVMASLERHIKCDSWQEGFAPMPETWLNQKRWSNDPPTKEKPE